MKLVSFAFAGVQPEIMGIGPIPSTEKALRKAGLTIDDIGLFELNEAFAIQVISLLDHFGIADDDPRVNPWGGAIALGHPLAASGVRLMIQLAAHFAQRPDVRYGLTAMCVGLGQGGSMIWENPHYDGKAEVTPPDERASNGATSNARCLTAAPIHGPRRPAGQRPDARADHPAHRRWPAGHPRSGPADRAGGAVERACGTSRVRSGGCGRRHRSGRRVRRGRGPGRAAGCHPPSEACRASHQHSTSRNLPGTASGSSRSSPTCRCPRSRS